MEAPSRELGCGERLEAGESRYEQAGAQHPVGHSGGQDARHPAGTRDGDLQEISARGKSQSRGGGGALRSGTITESAEGTSPPLLPFSHVLGGRKAAEASGCLPPSVSPPRLLPGHVTSHPPLSLG